MIPKEIEAAVITELHQIAPDIGMEDVDRSADLREEFDIDSMDFLNLVTALGKALGNEMPEADYPRMRSFEGLVSYLQEQAG